MKEEKLITLAPGETVTLGKGIKAKILSVCVTGQSRRVTYECVWWNNGSRNVSWIDRIEIETDGSEQKLGFQFAPTDV